MSDLIDRQSAVDIVIEYVKKLCEPIGTPEDNEMYSYGRGLLISILLNLKHLPSTQPDNDMIHLQKEQAYLQGWEEGREALKVALRAVPSAEPEIIYCKDCRHNGSYDTDCPINWGGKEYCSFAE